MSATAAIRALIRTTRPDSDDGVLLSAAVRGDEAAFAELVGRTGPMVLGVCRRVLGPSADADDAFQQTFLALVKHADAVRTPAALPGWLHRTAFRSAVKLKARRIAPADAPEPTVTPDPLAELSWNEVRAILDEELNALPDHLRGPLVLCYLDGRTRDDAAAALGVSPSTLKRRLADGLDRLNRRLTRRGVAGVGLAAAVASGRGLTAQVPSPLAGHVAAAFGVRPAGVASVVTGWKVAVSAVVLAGGIAAGVGLLAGPVQPPPKEAKADTPKPRTDTFGEPLPEGAIVRLGSTLFRHAGVGDFAILPDDKSVISGGSDNVLRTWDLATGRETRKVTMPVKVRWGGCISPDGKLGAGFADKNLTVFDTETGKERATFPAPGKDFHSTFFSPDGATLAVLTWEPRLTLVEWATGKRREFPLPERKVGRDSTYHGYFSPSGKLVVAGGGSGESLSVFDVATGELKQRLHYSATRSTITPDDKTLVATGWKPNVPGATELVTFALATGEQTSRFDLAQNHSFFSLDISPDGKTVACGCSDVSCLVDLGTGRLLHRLSGRPIGVAFTRDGTRVVGCTGMKLRVWTAADGKEHLDRPGDLGNGPIVLAASPDGRWLASADWLEQVVSVWDLTDGRLARTLPIGGDERRYIRGLGFSPDSRTLWAANYKGFVQWWDVATGKESRSVQLATPDAKVLPLDYLYQIRVSDDGKTAAALGRIIGPETSTLAVWDIGTGELKGARSIATEQRAWAWSGDGGLVALSTANGLIVADGTDPSRTRFTVPGVAANSPVAFSPDGRLVAARKPGDKGEVIVVEVATGGVVATVTTGPAKYLALPLHGRTLVAASDTSVSAFDVATGTERVRRPLPAAASGLVLPDEALAITGLEDGTGLVWDMASPTPRPKPSADTPARLWDALADKSAAAFKAGWELADRPADAVALLRAKLKPARPADAAAVKALVARLDDDEFAEREAATKELQALGAAAAPALRAALQAKPSPEQTARIRQVLAAANAPVLVAGEHLRELRAVAVLERIGTADARKLLDELAGGVPDARLTAEAKAAASRLKGRAR